MTTLYERRLKLLQRPEHHKLFTGIRHGIEREALRVSPDARLAQTAHPRVLGKTLTHPYITTDYSEALLEFITPVHNRIDDTLDFLNELHVFTSKVMGDELLWAGSMPSILEGEARIPIAQYGHSNSGVMKSVYREGLAHRYGKAMQTIAGLHYNFSLPAELWYLMGQSEGVEGNDQTFQSGFYLGLIRNFRRYSWLLMYLFGASPAVSKSFFAESKEAHSLQELDRDSLYLPYATSLRMSDMGYTNNAQSSLNICYNTVEEYVASLSKAIKTPYPAYEKIGVKQGDKYLQLNTNLLQIENEYYSNIRPKRIARRGEKPLTALGRRGIEYIEVRCLDINPFEPLGISSSDAHFLDVFLVYSGLKDSPAMTTEQECRRTTENFRKTVEEGRRPGLMLESERGPVSLQGWGLALLEDMLPVAQILDEANNTTRFTSSLTLQQDKLNDVSLTPSAKLMHVLQQDSKSYTDVILDLSKRHQAHFAENEVNRERQKYFESLAEESIENQRQLEASDTLSFDEFLQHYHGSD
ncbi:glutamate--cysteine ligase [Endozoicomonas montiporae]|uniref:Glutamate--cysteine ligase n=2 Tax=Endozoicomonas montiporae TaxID=1027273 RepID=A0A081MZN3_9GAMM|nr:glutamate--cysteine ligase [Endozoicomonas montiporae]AMO54656.1 glutamate--cysteine ligase [Endozoicomonas montiporae CL-33]KEQ11656.1 glutamate--cysteine ligase [Endozoicomonas montiporae]